eukprot:SAG22_NODE_19679_length_272_cov_1.179191_1_plen_72_part_01
MSAPVTDDFKNAREPRDGLCDVARYTEATPTFAEASSFSLRDDGGAPMPDATLSTNMSSGGFRLEQSRPTDI